jgi:hypothetical protein
MHAPAKPTPGTDPVPQEQRPRLLPPGAITALRVVGHDVEVALPSDKDTFTIGSKTGAVDVVLPLKQISRLQALGQRDGTWITFRDQSSTNGQFLNGRPEPTIHIAAGQVFRWANVDIIALDDHLRELRERLAWFLGFDAHARVDAALVLAAHDGPILLTARKTCQPAALARAIHRASGRRAEPFRVLDVSGGARQADVRPIFAQATRGTVYLDLTSLDGAVPDHLARWLVGDDYGVRAVVSAPSADFARKLLEHYAMRFSEIEVPTIASRRQDAPRLLDGLLQDLGSSRRVAELGRDRVAALAAFAWPEDIDQLRRAAERIQAYLDHDRSVAAAAAALSVKPQSLHEALTRIGALGGKPR